MSELALTPPPHPRSPWQRLYAGAHRWRRRWYRDRAAVLPRPVVSVGNLHWGGTGKTPLTSAIARHLAARGLNVTILSRGYKSRGRGVRIVSVGEGPLLGPLVAGDEPVVLAAELPGVSVVVGPDRYQAGLHAIERLPRRPDIFLLEDGFSHVRLHRELDLLTFPTSDPFGGGRLFPSGRLREPLASCRDADAAVLVGPDALSGEDLGRSLAPFGFRGVGFFARSIVGEARVERGEQLAEGSRVLLVTGIARPERVVESLAALPYELAGTLHYPDHHDYPAESRAEIERQLAESGADWVLTTAKDHVKLLGQLEAPLALLPLRTEPEQAFWRWLERHLEDVS